MGNMGISHIPPLFIAQYVLSDHWILYPSQYNYCAQNCKHLWKIRKQMKSLKLSSMQLLQLLLRFAQVLARYLPLVTLLSKGDKNNDQ